MKSLEVKNMEVLHGGGGSYYNGCSTSLFLGVSLAVALSLGCGLGLGFGVSVGIGFGGCC